MSAGKVIGALLLVFAGYTVIGMFLMNQSFWTVYNYVTLVFSTVCGIVLLRQK